MLIKIEGLWKNGIKSTPFFHSPIFYTDTHGTGDNPRDSSIQEKEGIKKDHAP